MAQFLIFNGPMPTTAAHPSVTTGTSLKTLLQFKASATLPAKIKAWGISFDGAADAAKIKCELLETGLIAATVTAHVAADLSRLDADALACGDPTTNLIQVGTTATGYTSSGEGTITASRPFDLQLVSPAGGYFYQFPLGDEPRIQVASIARIRVHAPAAVNAFCWMRVEI
jgi:hypothetical protein